MDGPDAGAETGNQEGIIDGKPGAQELLPALAVVGLRIGRLHGGNGGHGWESCAGPGAYGPDV